MKKRIVGVVLLVLSTLFLIGCSGKKEKIPSDFIAYLNTLDARYGFSENKELNEQLSSALNTAQTVDDIYNAFSAQHEDSVNYDFNGKNGRLITGVKVDDKDKKVYCIYVKKVDDTSNETVYQKQISSCADYVNQKIDELYTMGNVLDCATKHPAKDHSSDWNTPCVGYVDFDTNKIAVQVKKYKDEDDEDSQYLAVLVTGKAEIESGTWGRKEGVTIPHIFEKSK